ncbi:hypothetical protein J3F83DRAFT_712515 [Trichoderma novae-zelandiae]
MSPREQVRRPLLADGTPFVLARDALHNNAGEAGEGPGPEVLTAEDAAQFDERGGAPPGPEQDDELDSDLGDDDVAVRTASVRRAALRSGGEESAGALALPELVDGSSASETDEDDWRSLGYWSDDDEDEVEEDQVPTPAEPEAGDAEDDEDDGEDAEEAYVLLWQDLDAMSEDSEPLDWGDPANDVFLAAYRLLPLQRW